MHDPSTLAFDIRYPWKDKDNFRNSFIRIWHVDPEKDGTDDSCGWFISSRHLDQAVLDKIIKEFELDWDDVFEGKYNCGLFLENGQPHFSVSGITLNLFYKAALQIFIARQKGEGYKWQKKARNYIQKHLADILLFAENPTDSLFDSITRKFEEGCKEEYTKEKRDERIKRMASIIYSYIERDLRPWYKHPKWHVHHWKIDVIPFCKLKRFIFARCCYCNKRFAWNESVIGNWNGDKVWHSRCDQKRRPSPKC